MTVTAGWEQRWRDQLEHRMEAFEDRTADMKVLRSRLEQIDQELQSIKRWLVAVLVALVAAGASLIATLIAYLANR